MVQKFVNDVRALREEVRKLRGEINSLSIGGHILPGVVPGTANIPTPVEGAIIYGTGVPDWARLAPPSPGDDYTLRFMDGDTAPSWQVGGAGGGDDVFTVGMAAAL